MRIGPERVRPTSRPVMLAGSENTGNCQIRGAGLAMKTFAYQLFLLVLLSGLAGPATARTLADEAVAWLQTYLKIDTINPPGNESRGASGL